jgi:hypothetical protein
MEIVHHTPVISREGAESPTEFFVGQLRRLPGVVRIETRPSDGPAGASIRIYVSTADVSTEDSIYALEQRTYEKHEDALLDIHIVEAIDWDDPTDTARSGAGHR